MKKQFCVISHTHWDREWYEPFEVMRLNLKELIDKLLDVIDEHPGYIFHLDEQTVVIEDYFQLGEKNSERFKNAVKNGNIIIGPWYIQSDFYLTSGESAIRNLLFGNRICEEYGVRNKVGYMPDQFGLVSQLPQILRGFGIDVCIFGRGYHFFDEYDKPIDMPSEFLWSAPDGSKVTAIFLKYWYNNAQHIDASKEFISKLNFFLEDYAKTSSNPFILLMNGVDHLFPQPDVTEQIDELKRRFDIRQYSLPEYCAKVREYYGGDLTEYCGELRNGNDYQILKGCLSSRINVKILNVRAQIFLEKVLEPLTVMAEIGSVGRGHPVDTGTLDYLWKSLIKMHAHDNICGCSTDSVYRHMEDAFERFSELAEASLKKVMGYICSGDPSGKCDVLVANTTQRTYNGLIVTDLPFPEDSGYELYDGEKKVDYSVLYERNKKEIITSPYNLPVTVPVKDAKIAFNLSVPAYSFKFLSLKRKGDVKPDRLVKSGQRFVSNGKIGVFADGKAEIRFGEKRIRLYLTDTGDKGDSYIHVPAGPEILYDFSDAEVEVYLCDKLQRMTLRGEVTLPERFDFAGKCRSENTVNSRYELSFTLTEFSDTVESEYVVFNNSRDHKLCLRADTGFESDILITDSPFDVLYHDNSESYKKTLSNTFANTSFCAVSEREDYFAILTEGQHEAELRGRGVVDLTLLRATGVISRTENGECAGGDKWFTDGNQRIGRNAGRIGFCFEKSVSGILRCVENFRVKPITFVSDKFMGHGKDFALQKGDSNYYDYCEPPVLINPSTPLIGVSGEGLEVSALKTAFSGNGYVLRIVNYGEKETFGSITVPKGYELYLSDMSEKLSGLKPEGAGIAFNAKEIKTFVLKKTKI